MPSAKRTSVAASVSVRPLAEPDLDRADEIFRVAFGTFLGVPEPKTFFGTADYVRTRWAADPHAAFAATVEGKVVGSNFAAGWGSVGYFGPLTVRPDLWDQGIGRRLMEPSHSLLETRTWERTGAGRACRPLGGDSALPGRRLDARYCSDLAVRAQHLVTRAEAHPPHRTTRKNGVRRKPRRPSSRTVRPTRTPTAPICRRTRERAQPRPGCRPHASRPNRATAAPASLPERSKPPRGRPGLM
ncbi:GNAT family N-acetyltransferase [Streptomyces chartreusis]|uniref:GNAT family N-acetyltransferase n=1 Tax=Streptomyces chartreusis TaxID=1969 RepID=UPI0039B77EF9